MCRAKGQRDCAWPPPLRPCPKAAAQPMSLGCSEGKDLHEEEIIADPSLQAADDLPLVIAHGECEGFPVPWSSTCFVVSGQRREDLLADLCVRLRLDADGPVTLDHGV